MPPPCGGFSGAYPAENHSLAFTPPLTDPRIVARRRSARSHRRAVGSRREVSFRIIRNEGPTWCPGCWERASPPRPTSDSVPSAIIHEGLLRGQENQHGMVVRSSIDRCGSGVGPDRPSLRDHGRIALRSVHLAFPVQSCLHTPLRGGRPGDLVASSVPP